MKQRPSTSAKRTTNGPSPRVKGRSTYERLTPSQREARHRAYEVIGEMRSRDISLQAASRFVGTTPASVRRHAADALVKEKGRYRATTADRAYMRMSVLSVDGVVDIDTRGSRIRSLVGRHWNAIQRFGVTGDVTYLRPFVGKRAGGMELASDPDLIEEYLRQGEIDIDDIYA
jgi:hypothetical protein